MSVVNGAAWAEKHGGARDKRSLISRPESPDPTGTDCPHDTGGRFRRAEGNTGT